MLSPQTNSAMQTDALSTENIGRLDPFQPQVFSLLTDRNNPSPKSKSRRKKTPKLDEIAPVMINPHITRGPLGVPIAAPQHRSARLAEASPYFLPTHPTDDTQLRLRLYKDNSYNANTHTSHKQMPVLSLPQNRSSPVQTQANPIRMNEPIPVTHSNSMIPIVTQSQLYGLNSSLPNHVSERFLALSSSQQNLYQRLYSPVLYVDQSSMPLDHDHFRSTPLSSIPASSVLASKPRRRAPKRTQSVTNTEQSPQLPHYTPRPPIPTQSTLSPGLPSIIPASVTMAPLGSHEHCLLKDMVARANCVSLTPPSSISSAKSSPTDSNCEFSLPATQSRPPSTAEVASTSRAFPSSQDYLPIGEPDRATFINNLHYMSSNGQPQYGSVSPQVRPMDLMVIPGFSGLPGTDVQRSLVQTSAGVHKEKKRREKKKPSSVPEPPTHKQTLSPKLSPRNKLATEKRKQRKSSTKDIRAKHELRRITHRNRLAVLKFMMRKRRQQKPLRTTSPSLPGEEFEAVATQSDAICENKPEPTELILPEIIAPCLKISIDAAQNIESISLHYHRRRNSETMARESSPTLAGNADNKLGLLIEALEFMETLRENSKLDTLSVNRKV